MAKPNSVNFLYKHAIFAHTRSSDVGVVHFCSIVYRRSLNFARIYHRESKALTNTSAYFNLKRNNAVEAAPITDRTPVDCLPDVIPENPEQLTEEQALLIKRDVSRMPRQYRDRMAHVDRPPEILFEKFKRRGFQRSLYGTYGESKSGVSPAMAWPTIEEIREKVDREQRLGKPTLQESWEHLRTQREIERKTSTEREKKIMANMKQMKQQIREFRQRRKLIEDASSAEQQKRQLLLDEARDTLGFDVDPRDPRFLQLMEDRQMELKKKRRVQKRQDKEDSIINRLKDMVEEDTSKSAKAAADDEK